MLFVLILTRLSPLACFTFTFFIWYGDDMSKLKERSEDSGLVWDWAVIVVVVVVKSFGL